MFCFYLLAELFATGPSLRSVGNRKENKTQAGQEVEVEAPLLPGKGLPVRSGGQEAVAVSGVWDARRN